ncbi:MAG TPA: phosphoribosylanthranilate isomerase [Bryobacteraceae bacterium]|nr:phosphoribosylanthranilate isomerase [Bryobacteraceae bacterium]
MIVKVCGITRREDAVAAVEAGASALGFIFYEKSPRYVRPERAAELGDGFDAWKVGVFVDESPAAIEAVIRAARLDVAQVYGGDAPEGARIWRAFRIDRDWHAGGLPRGAGEALFLDGAANGISFDWNIARDAAEKVIIAGGLDASNVAEAIRVARPWGVDASSKLELAPGIKDHEKVRRFIQAARDAS